LSRLRRFPGRSKAAALIAAGAVTVAAAATAVAATSTQGPSGPLGPAGRSHETDVGLLLAGGEHQVTQVQAISDQQGTASQAMAAYEIRDMAAELAAAHWAAAREQAVKKAATSQSQQPPGNQGASLTAMDSGSAQQIALRMLASFGWSSSQFSCLVPLWAHESGWSVTAYNPGTGAYGIPQALPGDRMASAGPDWQTDAATQIRWGLEYIKDTYGSPCAAWSHEEATGWY